MVEIMKGQKALDNYLKKMSNPQKMFDPDVKKIARQAVRVFVKETQGKGNLKTGNTARGWTTPKKIRLSEYLISNNVLTKPTSLGQKRYNIVRILDEGHGVIRPKRKKVLYIPLTPKGVNRGGEFGIDYILSKKVEAVRGRNFIEKRNIDLEKGLIRLMLKRIAEA